MKLHIKKRTQMFHLIAISDIAFLLLIFLVVTSSLEYSQEIVPPDAKYTDTIKKEHESIPIEVTRNGGYSLLGYMFTLDQLSSMMSSISREATIKIFADKNVDFSKITKLMDALQSDNRLDVFLMMQKDNETENK